MISNEIQKLLSDITKSLIQSNEQDFEALITGKSSVANLDLHRYEIFHKKITSIEFSLSSFRGAFIDHSSFVNCSFVNCSFVTTTVNNTQFTNCTFTNCVFRSMYIEGNSICNCAFENCYIEDNIFSTIAK